MLTHVPTAEIIQTQFLTAFWTTIYGKNIMTWKFSNATTSSPM